MAGAIPTTSNNPGDLEIGDQGSGTVSGKTIFSSIEDGWNALTNQVSKMLYGGSSVYNPSMTIAQAGQLYSGGDPNWANNVATSLGVSVDTPLNQIPGGAAAVAADSSSSADAGTVSQSGFSLGDYSGTTLAIGGAVLAIAAWWLLGD